MAAMHAAGLAGAVALKFAPYTYLLYTVCAVASLFCLMALLLRRLSDHVGRAMFLSVSLAALLVVGRDFPFLAAGGLAAWGWRGLAAWGWRGLVKNTGGMRDHPLRRFLSEWFVAGGAMWWSGAGMWASMTVSLALVLLARLVSSRLKEGEGTLAGEGVAAAFLAVALGLDPANLVYVRDPLYAAAVSAIAGFLFHQTGVQRKGSALVFALCGTVFFASGGHEAFAFFFMFTLLVEAGRRMRLPEAELEEPGSAYPVFSLLAAAACLLSSGADDPFPLYFVFAGILSVGVFQSWSRAGRGRGSIWWGLAGVSILSAVSWLSGFIPSAGAPVVLLAGAVATLVTEAEAVLRFPASDAPFLSAILGAAAGAVTFTLASALLT